MKIRGVHAIPLAIPMKPMAPPSTWTAGTRKQIVVREINEDAIRRHPYTAASAQPFVLHS